MEPLDCVVRINKDGAEIWAGDQFQTVDQANAAHVLGLKPEQVKIHTLYAGGSFGRRANTVSDYVVEGAEIARSEEHTSELQSLMRISYAVFCLKKKKKKLTIT